MTEEEMLDYLVDPNREIEKFESNMTLTLDDQNYSDPIMMLWNKEMTDFDPEIIFSFELEPG
jgi:hypothetical protein